MPLPSLSKTWQHAVNQSAAAQGSAGLTNRNVLRLIKNALKGFGSNPWTVVSSSNGTVANSSDNWASAADMIGANPGVAHSWIVLRQTGIATNFEICLDCSGAGAQVASIVVSPSAGFTGGSTTARPTATDEIAIISAATWTANASDVTVRYSVSQSTDGQCTRVWGAAGGTVAFCWVFDKPADPVTGWTNPSASWALAAAPSYSTTVSTSAGRMRSGSTTGSLQLLCDGGTVCAPNDTAWANVANEISSEWALYPASFACTTSTIRGRHGRLFDLWLSSSALASGDTFPGDGTATFVQVGIIVLPWNGGAVNLS